MVGKAGMIFSPNWEWVVGRMDGEYAGDIRLKRIMDKVEGCPCEPEDLPRF